jgi:hypothetical protein
MITDYVSRQHMLDALAVKDGEIANLKKQIEELLNKAALKPGNSI